MANFACTACDLDFNLDLPGGTASCRCPVCGSLAKRVVGVCSPASIGAVAARSWEGGAAVLPLPFTPNHRPERVRSAVEPEAASSAADAAEEEEPLEDGGNFGLNWLQMHASFLTSICVHTVMLLVLAMLIVPRPQRAHISLELAADPGDAALAAEDLEMLPALEMPAPSMPLETFEVAEEEQVELEVEQPMPEPVSQVETDLSQLLQSASGQGEGSDFGSGLGGGGEYGEIMGRVAREGGGSGDVQISLAWDNFNDIDLHVICPSGEEIYYQNPRSRCGGALDVDMNAGGRQSREPVENIVWSRGEAPRGEYKVLVNHYASHGDPDPTRFRVAVRVGGQVKLFNGQLGEGDPKKLIYTFSVDSSLPPASPSGSDFPL